MVEFTPSATQRKIPMKSNTAKVNWYYGEYADENGTRFHGCRVLAKNRSEAIRKLRKSSSPYHRLVSETVEKL